MEEVRGRMGRCSRDSWLMGMWKRSRRCVWSRRWVVIEVLCYCGTKVADLVILEVLFLLPPLLLSNTARYFFLSRNLIAIPIFPVPLSFE